MFENFSFELLSIEPIRKIISRGDIPLCKHCGKQPNFLIGKVRGLNNEVRWVLECPECKSKTIPAINRNEARDLWRSINVSR